MPPINKNTYHLGQREELLKSWWSNEKLPHLVSACNLIKQTDKTAMKVTGDLEKVNCTKCLLALSRENAINLRRLQTPLNPWVPPWQREARLDDPLRGLPSQVELDREVRWCEEAEARKRARLAEHETFFDGVWGEGIIPYVGMNADYVEVDRGIVEEAWEKGNCPVDVDCDEEELLRRMEHQDVDWDGLWVLKMAFNRSHGR